MNKILLVDDEQATKDGIKFFVESNQFNLEIIAEAENGEEALEKIREFNPDIVMTDIKMPIMDGIELACHIKEEYPHIKIIFISGYEDVNYLRSALKVDAVDYILKPVKLAELKALFSRVSSDVDNEKKKQQHIYDMERRIMQSMPLLRQRLFMLMINDWMDDIDSIRHQMDFLNIRFSREDRLCVVCISINNYKDTVNNMSLRERQCLAFAVLNIFQEIVDKCLNGYTFENALGEFVGIVSLDKEDYEDELLELAAEVKKNFMESLELDATLCVGEVTNSLATISASYASAKAAIGNEMFLDESKTISMDSISNVNYDTMTAEKTYEKITKLLRDAAENELFEFTGEIFYRLKNEEYSSHYKFNVFIQLMMCGMKFLNETGQYSSSIELYEYQTLQKLTRQIDLEEAKEVILQYYSYICSQIRNKRVKKSSSIIGTIKDIIERRYMENLKVGDIAAEVFLSPTYMCLVFKKETGMTINEYLTSVRIEEAKRLLRDPNIKLGNVGMMVGYENQSYFARLFKKHVGCIPSEYGRKNDE